MIWGRVLALIVAIYDVLPVANSFRVSSSLHDIQVTADPDTYLPVPKIIRRRGYPAEAHIIKSDDGYLLEYHRIPHGKNSWKPKRSYPLLLHHGLLCSSIDWIINEPERSLGYKLADEGYDIWLGNGRGNTYSRSHVSLTPKQKEFWNFTFHEMGVHDLAAAIDYVLNVTGSEKLVYIGHSQGTTMFYALMSVKPEYNEKVLFHVGVAPVANLAHTTSAFRHFVPVAKQIETIFNLYSNGAFLEHDILTKVFCKILCGASIFNYNLCERIIIFKLFGKDVEQFNQTMIPLIMTNMPAGTSGKNMIHSAQLISSGKFAFYDYGLRENIIRYHSAHPPIYNISKITVPIKFYYGKNDLISNPLDVKLLYQQIPKPMGCKVIPYQNWNHVDFLWAKNVNRLFNEDIIEFLNNATDNPEFINRQVKISLWERNERPAPINVQFDAEKFSSNNFNGLTTLGNVSDIVTGVVSENSINGFSVNLKKDIEEHAQSMKSDIQKEVNKVNLVIEENVQKTGRSIKDVTEKIQLTVNSTLADVQNKVDKSVKEFENKMKDTWHKLQIVFHLNSTTAT